MASPRPLASALLPLGLCSWPLPAAAEHPLDVNLATALDVSDSMMRHEEWVLLEGLGRALTHPAFLAAALAGPHGRVGFSAFLWADEADARVVVPWSVIGSAADAARVAAILRAIPRRWVGSDGPPGPERLTDISGALRFGQRLLATAPHPSELAVFNLCGNGVDNVGEAPDRARDRAVAAGTTVNGLVIGEAPKAFAYYRDHVAGGPGSFVMQAAGPERIAEAMLRKLLLDLRALAPVAPPRLPGRAGQGRSRRCWRGASRRCCCRSRRRWRWR